MSEQIEERYLYTVNPKKPIKSLNPSIPTIRTSKSLLLTKEEVLKCFECGPVYRRFSNIGLVERISKADVDRVHRTNYISKEDWKKIQKTTEVVENKVNGVEEADVKPIEIEVATKEETIPEEEVKEEVKTVEENIIENNIIEEETKEEESVDLPADIQETEEIDVLEEDAAVEDTDVEESENDSDESIVEEEEEPTKISEPKQTVTINYNGKKKKHHH